MSEERVYLATANEKGEVALPPSVVSSSLKALGEVEGNVTPNLAEGRVFTMTAKGAVTIQKPTNWPTGATYAELVITQKEPGGHAVTLEGVKWLGNPLTVSTVSNEETSIQLVSYNGGATWFAIGHDEAIQAEAQRAQTAEKGLALNTTTIDLCRQYGAEVGKDITKILQEAIEALTTAGGGTIYFSKPGVYRLEGAIKSGEGFGYKYAGQILFPAVKMTEKRVPIRIEGCTPITMERWGAAVEPVPARGVILLSTLEAENRIFDVIPAAETGVPKAISNVEIMLSQLAILAPINHTNMTALMLETAASADIRNCLIGINKPSSEVSLGGNGLGVVLPYLDNAGHSTIADSEINGYGIGVVEAEHTILDNTCIRNANVAIRPWSATNTNLSEYRKCHIHGCETAVGTKPGSALGGFVYGTLSLENVTNAVKDTENLLRGELIFLNKSAANVKLTVIGASLIKIRNLSVTPGPLTLPWETTEIPATPVSGTGYTNTTYRDAVVYLKATTLEKVEVDGVERPVPGATAGMVVVRAGGTIKVTGTALGTWAWDLL